MNANLTRLVYAIKLTQVTVAESPSFWWNIQIPGQGNNLVWQIEINNGWHSRQHTNLSFKKMCVFLQGLRTETCTVNPCYNGSICSQKCCHYNKFAVLKNPLWTKWYVRKALFYSYFSTEHMFWIFVRIASLRRFWQISKTYVAWRDYVMFLYFSLTVTSWANVSWHSTSL